MSTSSSFPRPSRRQFVAGLGLGFVGLTAGGGSALAQAAAKRGGTLIVGINADPPALSILASAATLTNCTAGQLFSTLITLSPDGDVEPSLAKSWTISEDGTVYTFKLRTDVLWHDGKPFTAEDVRFSMVELNGRYNALARSSGEGIKSVEAPDAETVVITLKQPDPAFFPWAFSQQEQSLIHPKHIYEGTDVPMNPANLKPIGTGAFKFTEWKKGSHLTFDRNPDYFNKDAVLVDKVIFQIIPDAGARQLALEKGDIDYVPFFGLSAASADALEKAKDVKVFDSVRPAQGIIMAYMNTRNEFMAKIPVRQAISYAIDRKALVALALNGRGKAATGPIRSDSKGFYNPDVTLYARDVEKAKALLDQAGAVMRGRSRFAIRLAYQNSGEGGALQSAGEIMREHLREVGIELQLVPGDYATVWDRAYLHWDFDLAMGSFFTGPDPKISVSPKYISSNIKKATGANLMGYENPKVDELLNAADSEMNPQKRNDLYRQAQTILVDEVPALWLWEKTYPSASRDHVIGLPSGMNHWEPYENVGFTK